MDAVFMPRNSSGQYSLPNGTLVSAGQVIQVSQHNPAMQDIETALSQSLSRTGSGAMQADLDVGGFAVKNASSIGTLTAAPFALRTNGANRVLVDQNGVVNVSDVPRPHSGRLRVSAFSDNYAIGTYDFINYRAMQFARDVAGTTKEIGVVFVTDFSLSLVATDNLILAAGGADALRIDPFRTIHIGANSVPGSGRVRVSETGISGYCINTNGSGVYTALQLLTVGVQVGGIVCDGAQSYFNTTSDARAKRGIADAGDFGSLIDAARVRSFDYVANGAHQRAGFVAQELREIIPEVVHVPADPEQMMAVDHSRLVPFLWAELQSVRKRLAAAGL